VSLNFPADNLKYNQSQTGKFSGQQITTTLNSLGATHAVRLTVLSQFTPGAGDYFYSYFACEGLNLAHLQWGTTDAAPVSLQFKARASVAGTYSGSFRNGATTRTYPFTFTLAANTDTLVKIENIPGCLDGAWVTDNNTALYLSFCYGTDATYGAPSSGSWLAANYVGVLSATSLVSQIAGSTLDISDVQLEKGSFCTTFERKLYDQVLRECQRYYETCPTSMWSGMTTSAQPYYTNDTYKVTKRIVPTWVGTDIGSNSGFPATAPVFSDSNTSGFRAYKSANATSSGGYYQFSWTASARL
jgi:hypothetical protein